MRRCSSMDVYDRFIMDVVEVHSYVVPCGSDRTIGVSFGSQRRPGNSARTTNGEWHTVEKTASVDY